MVAIASAFVTTISLSLLLLSSLRFVTLLLHVTTAFGSHPSNKSNNNNNRNNKNSNHNDMTKLSSDDHHSHESTTIKIAHIGNSIQYYNDCPRLLQQMIRESKKNEIQDSCLRGGASITSLWQEGNGMKHKFTSRQQQRRSDEVILESDGSTTHPHQYPHDDVGSLTIHELLTKEDWDYLIMNDYTQGPARTKIREKTIRTLRKHIIPLLHHHQPNTHHRKKITIPIVIQTQAYRSEGIKDTHDLGTFDEFTILLRNGVHEYVRIINEEFEQEQKSHPNVAYYTYEHNENTAEQKNHNNIILSSIARVAPVGDGYQYIRQHDKKLFMKLYSWDEFHPSLYGTWFQSCILYCIIMNDIPPVYNPVWWHHSRYIMPPPDHDQYYHIQYPTTEEAEQLRIIACHICNITISKM